MIGRKTHEGGGAQTKTSADHKKENKNHPDRRGKNTKGPTETTIKSRQVHVDSGRTDLAGHPRCLVDGGRGGVSRAAGGSRSGGFAP